MKILLAGEGGQGVQLAAEVLTYAAFLRGKQSSFIPNFGVEQRGGVSLAFIIIDEDPSYPKFDKAELLTIFCDRAIERVKGYIDERTKLLYGPGVTNRLNNKEGAVFSDDDLPPKVWNILALRKIVETTGILQNEDLKNALMKKLAGKFKKDPQLKELNLKALGFGQ